MLKFTLLASALAFAAPAMAQTQTQPSTPPAPQGQTQPMPEPAMDATTPQTGPSMTGTPDTATPADTATTAETAPATDAAPVKGTEIADVVSAEFPTYDKDANGGLNSSEFGSWMVALRTASDPSTKAESAEIKTWIGQAFASADADKSKSVSQGELTAFLSKAG